MVLSGRCTAVPRPPQDEAKTGRRRNLSGWSGIIFPFLLTRRRVRVVAQQASSACLRILPTPSASDTRTINIDSQPPFGQTTLFLS